MKKQRATYYTHRFLSKAFDIWVNIYSSYNEDMMCWFLNTLLLIVKVFREFSDIYSGTPPPDCFHLWRREFKKCILKCYEEKCYALVYSILSFGGRVEPYILETTNISALNTYLRISYTVSQYFNRVIERNGCFHINQPWHVRRTYVNARRRLAYLMRAVE